MRQVGTIARLQVQQSDLKAPPLPGERWERYVPAGLRPLSRCTLDEGGVTGWSEEGERILDMHHRDHPRSKYRGENGICIAFTAGYDVMRAQFGQHVADGLAGENILVRSDSLPPPGGRGGRHHDRDG